MGEAAHRGIWVEPEELEVGRRRIGALPVVNAVLGRLGFTELLSSYLPEPDPRCGLSAAKALGVLVRNLAVGRQPLYGLSAWAGGYDAALLGLEADETTLLNDDRVGRALDELFLADRASLVTELSLRAIRGYGIDVKELHNDSTSITLYGAYRDATGTPRGGVRPPVPERGFSKDHRGDLLTELAGAFSLVRASWRFDSWVRVLAHGHCQQQRAPGSRLADGAVGWVAGLDWGPLRALPAA